MPSRTKKRIAVVTGTRAEYGILKPLLFLLKKEFDLELLVTGMHLLPVFGSTVKDIQKDGFKAKTIEMYDEKMAGDLYYSEAMAEGIKGFAKHFQRNKPDFLLVFGDRLEPLAAVLAASLFKIPIGHIHAGDKTGSKDIDEVIRHTISRFSHLNFAPTVKAKQRLIKMGEESWRVFDVGALGLDSVLKTPIFKKEDVFKRFGFDPKKKLLVCLFHPIHLDPLSPKEIKEVIKAIKELAIQTVVIYPNNDKGGKEMIAEIEKMRSLSFVRIFPSLPHDQYINLLRFCSLLIGNSSSGIIEAPFIGCPVINIGLRQKGRERSGEVYDAKADCKELVSLVGKIIALPRKKIKSPYGNGKTADKIITILKKTKVDDRLLDKTITY